MRRRRHLRQRVLGEKKYERKRIELDHVRVCLTHSRRAGSVAIFVAAHLAVNEIGRTREREGGRWSFLQELETPSTQ